MFSSAYLFLNDLLRPPHLHLFIVLDSHLNIWELGLSMD